MGSESAASRAALHEAKAAAEELLERFTNLDITRSSLFPYGVNRIAIRVRAGDTEVAFEIAGPAHSDEDEDADWMGEDVDDLFDEGDER